MSAHGPALIFLFLLLIVLSVFKGLRWLWRNRHERFADIARRYQLMARIRKLARIVMVAVVLGIAVAIATEVFNLVHVESPTIPSDP